MSQTVPKVLEPILDDLCSRFILNVPDEERTSFERILFQVEQAHWFYEDFVRETRPELPQYRLRSFAAVMFSHCPILKPFAKNMDVFFEEFTKYKSRVPVMGGILLNEKLDKVLLVKGYTKGAGWSFPRGKINKDEAEYDCAVREVLEETGFNMTEHSDSNEFVEQTVHEQRIRLYIAKGISETTAFVTQTRKEIGDIQWWGIDDVVRCAVGGAPAVADGNGKTATRGKLYMVIPFVAPLRAWIKKERRRRNKGSETGTRKGGGTAVAGAPGPSAHSAEHLKALLGIGTRVEPFLNFEFDRALIQKALSVPSKKGKKKEVKT